MDHLPRLIGNWIWNYMKMDEMCMSSGLTVQVVSQRITQVWRISIVMYNSFDVPIEHSETDYYIQQYASI